MPRPELTWRFERRTAIRVDGDSATALRGAALEGFEPRGTRLRLETFGARWTASLLEPRADGVYVGSVEKPARGWTAFFVEMTYPSAGNEPLKFTTAVRVVPDTLPAEIRGHGRNQATPT